MSKSRPGADYNVKILRPLAMYLADKKGEKVLAEITAASGLVPEYLDGRNHWVSTAQFEGLLSSARATMESDDEFRLACAYHLPEAYGALAYVLKATGPSNMFHQSIARMGLVARVGKYEIVRASRTSMTVRWKADIVPNRLVCLTRIAQSEAFPTLWNLPPARVTQSKCMADGDDCCIYEMSWYDQTRWLPSVIGAALAGGAAVLLQKYGGLTLSGHEPMIFGLLGGMIGYVRELRATTAVNRRTDQALIEAMNVAVEDEMKVRLELTDYHNSQRDWTRLLEEENRQRVNEIRKIGTHFEQIEQSRSEIFRGYSHDLRNPLQVMRLGIGYLRNIVTKADAQGGKVLEELEWSVQQMNDLLNQLNKIAQRSTGLSVNAPQRLDVTELTEKIRRRLRALAHTKPIKATAFSTREAPPIVTIDPIVFDRIIDNLLTNAVKYTESGSIIVEIDGSPGFLVCKVSDTGRGISDADLESTFQPGGSDETKRAEHSLGVGLSVVVSLLAQIGGRLEIMSKPQVGTTFWIYLPVDMASKSNTVDQQQPMGQVVSIRRAQ